MYAGPITPRSERRVFTLGVCPRDAARRQRRRGLSAPELKLKKKDFKRLFDPTRELDGWERYRALIDASDEAYDLIDISNREARFALIVMGALNAMPLLLLTKTTSSPR